MLNEHGFDNWSKQYDHTVSNSQQGYPFEGYDRVLQTIREHVFPYSNKIILDIGIGTGKLSYTLYQAGATIWGIDFSSHMLQQAQQIMPHGKFIKWDMNDGLPTDIHHVQFHHIVSSYAFHHISHLHQVTCIQQLLPHIQATGSIIIADIGFPTQQALEDAKKQFSTIWDNNEYYWAADYMIEQLCRHQIKANYTQISCCAGVLTITK